MMILLVVTTMVAAQESYVIDSVCVGTERTYRRDGEAGYTYYWEIVDRQLNDTFGVAEVPFEEDLGNDTIYGSESTILWDTDGDYDIVVYVTSEHGCDTVEQGMVRVFPLPEARAGDDVVLCSFDDYILFGDTAWNYSQIYWGRTGDGTFSDEYSLHPTYTFGPNDILNGEVTLFITAEGLADNGTCVPAVDSVTILLSPSITIDSTAVLCYGQSVSDWETQVVSSLVDSVYISEHQTLSGCDSTLTLTVSIVDGFAYDSTAVLCYGQTVPDWETQVISSLVDSVYISEHQTLSGCDSTLTLTVSIVDGFAYDSTAVLCYGQSVSDWETQVISSLVDSVYISEHQTLSGCDSTLTLTVSIVDGFAYDSTAVLCYGQTVPDWETQVISSLVDSVYISEYQTVSGCDSTLTLTVSIVDGFTYDSTAVLCYGQTVPDWEGQAISSLVDSVYISEHQTAGGCDSTLTLTVSIIDGGLTEIYESACETFTWIAGNDSTYTESGIYDYISDLGTCSDTLRLHLLISPPMELIADPLDVLCYGDSTGAIDLTVSGGIAPYTILWSTGDTTEDLSMLPAGNYSVIVTDSLGCSDTTAVEIVQPDELQITLDAVTNVLAIGESTGSIEVSIGGGTPGYTYVWTNEAGDIVGTAEDLINQPAGDYTLTVTDANGCEAILIETITEPIATERRMSPVETPICYEDRNSFPLLDSLKQYLALHPDVEVFSDWGLDTSSFIFVDSVIIGGSEYCYEEIRTYSIQDFGGDTLSATHRIIVDDDEEPTISCPPGFSVSDGIVPPPLDSTGFLAAGGSFDDNCGIYSFRHVSDVSDGKPNPETITRTYEVTDFCGNTRECEQEIEVTKEIVIADIGPFCQFSPAPELPDTALNGTPGYWLPATINTDSAGIFDYVFYADSGYHAQPYTVSITIIPAIDLNTTLVDQGYNPNPVGSIDLDIEGGSAPYTVNWNGPGGYSASSEDIANLYAGDYWVEVSDNIGCYDSLSVTLRTFEPEFSCPPDTIFECPDVTQYPASTNIAEFIAIGGYFNPANIVASLTSFDVTVTSEYCLTIERTYNIEDIYGRLYSCTQTIDFHDTIPPVLNAPEGDTVECYSAVYADYKTYTDFIASGVPVPYDNCAIDPSSFTVRDTLINIEPGRAELIYYYSIADMCGNVGRDTTYFLILDEESPEVFCADITVYLDENGTYHISVQDSVAMVDSVYDNCTAPENLRVVIEVNEITCEDIESGTQARVIVYDEVGLSAECVANITVLDTVPPDAICQDITVYLDENGEVTITAEQINNTSTDNCEIASIDISRDRFDCTDVGVNLVQLIVTDIYGNTDTCEANVTVIDEIPPQITCNPGDTIQLSEEDGTFLLTWDVVTESAWDECGIDTVLLDQYLLDCDNIGRTTITATAYDINGNSSTCTSEFVVIGNTPPIVENDSAITAMDVPIDIPVTNNDFDLKTNIDISTLGVNSDPGNGSVVVDNRTGIVTYIPDPGFIGEDIFTYQILDDGVPCEPEKGTATVFITVLPANEPPVAVDDYFEVPCGELFGNVLYGDDFGNGKDYDPDADDKITVGQTLITPPDSGVFNWLDGDGNFEYIPFDGFFGTDSFQYVICDDGIPSSLCDTAWVFITRVPDNDCDGVADANDIDDDNDGIRDNIENGGYWPEDQMGLIDSDHDGIPDYMDIDSDNDGIPDNIEGQGEHNYIPPSGVDANHDGWDDVYDVTIGGVITFDEELTDTDGDSMPDYLDIDSDNDGVFDMIEGHDADHNGIADVLRWYTDEDHDGLDDAYDTYYGWADYGNEIGSNAPLQDFDDDGTRDWRDINDEDDDYMTANEDLNGNGDYSDDDLDLDGYPEYLDTELNCELFIPEGFSPNDDDVHDFFQILCIQKYPNAKLMIFNRAGVKLWEKEHYGNLDVWGTYQDAWWWGTSENVLTLGRSGGLPAGNYIYVLLLNDGKGTVKNGTVMLAY
ncbi:gliding motility-associated C-terminal domain-containing protein [uncultured Draconibacterium sp.]|uniref:T9SS type B sorting domain-containing protein n=1 Tax=uncultured Draconibacterium sp. TaxID=1573823 RepID=UPI0029C96A62|nr:Ig-like domain-containing protein [uncultured Draconibacterium sp.]